jgi:hypothetical protein
LFTPSGQTGEKVEKNWMLRLFNHDNKKGYHAKEILTNLNPVRAGIVEKEEEYFFSSCGIIMVQKKHFGVSNARGLKSQVI